MSSANEKYQSLLTCLASLSINEETGKITPEKILKEINNRVATEDFQSDEREFLPVFSQMLSNLLVKQPETDSKAENELIFQNLFTNISDAALILNFDWQFLEVNKAAEIGFGYNHEYLLRTNSSQVILNRCIDKLQRFITNETNDIQRFYDYAVSQDGKIIPVEIVAQRISYRNQVAIFLILKDIADRRETEREILQAIIGTEERERKRFAKDLHDGLGPLLSSLKLYLSAIERAANEERRKPILVQIHEVIDEAIRSIKEIANNISPHLLSNFGLVPAVRDFCNKINGANTLLIEFNSNCDELRFDRNLETILFRIIEEMMNNTIKHAQATTIQLSLNITGKMLQLIYSDNGRGFQLESTLSSPSRGMGISNIFNRVRTINGIHKIITSPGKGFTCIIDVAVK